MRKKTTISVTTGYVSEKQIYQCGNCSECPYKKEYIKGNNCKRPIEERNKALSAAKTFLKYREENLERIVSEEGILLRINRSLQAEGSFGELKQDMQFRRFLRRERPMFLQRVSCSQWLKT